MINARCETVAEKPSFRSAFRSRRCLVVADGFYEWRRSGKRAQPYLIRLRDHRPFGIAGVWESWRQPDGSPLLTCSLITTAANRWMAPIHDRMPVIVATEHRHAWLDPASDRAVLDSLLVACPEDALEAQAVSTHVNNPRNDDVRCTEALEAEPAAPD
jgi:putative SOS response-associated peptidase YedK